MKFLMILLLLLFFSSCSEVNTTQANEVYKYWSGSNPPTDLKLIKGQYWQSAHWTKEYMMSLKMKPTKTWWNTFIVQNKLEVDTLQ
ncbi:hypothetical protein ACFQ3R_12565 [Mesonia ostreae]|uniref:Uncharacterized protein n=1 Tax=Mesonia ostreae TaxID=861110 RepID=A0ABU2KFE2_9FLAO|nr:hypothetical protein [Mesonia ostreae]MDT0293418.1 hypothetical protein [Mesonia ostreae]